MKRFYSLVTTVVFAQQLMMAQCPSPLVPPADAINVIVNSGFETGVIGPSTAGFHALQVIGNSSPGRYKIAGTSGSFNVGMIPGIVPHSGSQMLMIDGLMLSNATAWEQTVTVQANRNYYFSAWLTALSPLEKSQLVFQVVPLLPVAGPAVNISAAFIPPNGPVWNQEFGTWFSGTTTSVTVRLINTNSLATGGGGNDYAIDDLLFRPSCVGVDAGPKPEFGAATLGLCNAGGSADLNANVAANPAHIYTWFKDGVFVSNPSTPDVLENQIDAGTYVVCLDSAGCVQSDTVTLVTALSIDLGANANLCTPAFKLLDTRISDASSFTIEWYRNNVLIPGQSGPEFTATGPGTYRVVVTDGGSCNGSDEVIITSQVDETIGDVICPAQGDNAASVSVIDAGGVYNWYDAPTGGALLTSGLTFGAAGVTGPVTYYVENTNPTNSSAGLPNSSSPVLSSSSSGTNNVHDQNLMNFTANKNAQLQFVDVYLEFFGNFAGNLTIRLDNQTAVTSSVTTFAINHTLGAGNFTITVPVNLPIINGNSYGFSITGVNGQFFTRRYADGAISSYFPSIREAATLTGGQAPTLYPGLFNWVFSHPSSCARTPAVVSEFCVVPPCVRPTSVALILLPNITSFCQGAALSINGVIDTASLTPLNGTYFFSWYKNGTLISPITNVYAGLSFANIQTTDAATYRLVVEDGNGGYSSCARGASVTISVDAPITSGSITANQSICSSNTALAFSSVSPASGGNGGTPVYQWESSSDGTTGWTNLPSTNNAIYSAGSVTSTSYYRRTATLGTACSAAISNVVSITVFPALTASSISSGQSICSNTAPVGLTEVVGPTGGTGVITYQWQSSSNGGSTWINASGTSTSANYNPPSLTSSLTYKVVISSGTCAPVESNSLLITVLPATTPTITLNTISPICIGTTVNFTTTVTNQGAIPVYQWLLNGGSVGTNSPAYSNASIANGDQVSVQLTSNLACATPVNVTSSIVTMDVRPTPTPQLIGTDTAFCSGLSVLFSSITGGGSLQWLSNGSPIVGASTASFSATTSGVFTLRENNGACSGVSSPVTVAVLPTPVADAGPDQNENDGTLVTLNGSGSSTLSWSPAPLLSDNTSPTPTYTAYETTTFVLRATDLSDDCSSTDEVTVTVFRNITIPNVFSPNGDGNNDTWEIKNLINYQSSKIEIFNIWGMVVWSSKGYETEWSGINFRNGEVLPDGTYFYIIELNSPLAKKPYTGYVQLVK